MVPWVRFRQKVEFMRKFSPLILIILAIASCAQPVAGPAPTPGQSAKPKPLAHLASPAPGATPPATTLATRQLGTDAIPATLTGKCKLISDHGGAVISNNSGELLSKVRYALTGAPAPEEGLLANAEIEFLDGEGKTLVGADGVPLRAQTDETGGYRFVGSLPAENLVARVRLWNGGFLQAMLVRSSAANRTLDLDTASTLGASYVLETFVRGQKAAYDRLTAVEADGLHRDLEAARGQLAAGTPTYQSADLVAAAEALRVAVPAVGQRLAEIKALLLVGQANLGNDRPATQVSLAGPLGLAGDAAGNLYIGEFLGGRIRRITVDGTIHRFPGESGSPPEVSLQGPTAIVRATDGTLYVADGLGHRVLAIADERIRVLVGTGRRAQGAAGVAADQFALMGPNALALAPDGRLWIGEHTKQSVGASRLLVVDGAGNVQVDARPSIEGFQFGGLAFAPDGALWALDVATDHPGLWRRAAGDDWAKIADGLAVNDDSRIVAAPDGSVFVAEQAAGRVSRVTADGTRTTIAGAETGSRLVAPAGLWLDGRGTLYVADIGAGQVVAISPPFDGSGKVTAIAGTAGVSQQGDALSIAINTPGGMALDSTGRLHFTEGGSHTVKRLDGATLSLVAGSVKGLGGDDGPATAARLDTPTGLAFAGKDLYVLDVQNQRIRRIAADGTITTAVGSGLRGGMIVPRLPAREVLIRRPTACAVAPDGRLYWVDNENAQVSRLNGDGTVDLIAGTMSQEGGEGDGGPAAEAVLSLPIGLAFDAQGDLYIADTGNGRIRKITGLDGATPKIEAFIGLPLQQALGQLGAPEPTGPVAGDQALLVGLTGLAFDANGDLYYAEVGTSRLALLLADSPLGALLDALPPRGARISKVTGVRTGHPMVEAVAGPGTGVLDKPGTDDSLVSPVMLLVDPAKGLYILDTGNSAIRLLPRSTL